MTEGENRQEGGEEFKGAKRQGLLARLGNRKKKSEKEKARLHPGGKRNDEEGKETYARNSPKTEVLHLKQIATRLCWRGNSKNTPFYGQ